MNEKNQPGRSKRAVIVMLAVLIALLAPLAIYGTVTAVAVNSGTLVLVSQDYIDNVLVPEIDRNNSVQNTEINALKERYNSLLEQYNALKAMLEAGVGSSNEENNSITAVTAGFRLIKLEMGKRIVPSGENEQCIELILQRGSEGAVVYSDVESLSILDASEGTELYNGTPVPVAHYILIPHANDGRAVVAENSDVWMLVRGEYTIE